MCLFSLQLPSVDEVAAAHFQLRSTADKAVFLRNTSVRKTAVVTAAQDKHGGAAGDKIPLELALEIKSGKVGSLDHYHVFFFSCYRKAP